MIRKLIVDFLSVLVGGTIMGAWVGSQIDQENAITTWIVILILLVATGIVFFRFRKEYRQIKLSANPLPKRPIAKVVDQVFPVFFLFFILFLIGTGIWLYNSLGNDQAFWATFLVDAVSSDTTKSLVDIYAFTQGVFRPKLPLVIIMIVTTFGSRLLGAYLWVKKPTATTF